MVVDSFEGSIEYKQQSEKKKVPQERLAAARLEVEKITDGLNKSIDEGIREGVAVLNALGVATTQSCEGHLDRGSPSPYIDITATGEPEHRFLGEKDEAERIAKFHDILPDEITSWPTEPDRKERAAAALLKLQGWQAGPLSKPSPEYETWEREENRIRETTARLIDEFYSIRSKPSDGYILLDSGRLRVGSSLYEKFIAKPRDPNSLSDSDRAQLPELLPRYQQEMRNFIEFLKEKYFQTPTTV